MLPSFLSAVHVCVDTSFLPHVRASKQKSYQCNFYVLLLDTATWLCQVKEYKIILEPSLLTG